MQISKQRIILYFLAFFFISCGLSFLFLTNKKPFKKEKKSEYILPSISVVDKQFNFHIVVPGVWRSAQTSEESIRCMKSYGLKTIISFRHNQEVCDWERVLCLQLGIEYYRFPIDSTKRQPIEKLIKILEIMHDPQKQPVLIHCQEGKDRAGLLSALYKVQFKSFSKEDAYKEMLMYGYSEKAYPYIIDIVRSWNKASALKMFDSFVHKQ